MAAETTARSVDDAARWSRRTTVIGLVALVVGAAAAIAVAFTTGDDGASGAAMVVAVIGVLMAGTVGVFGLLFGGVALNNVRRVRRILAVEPWRAVGPARSITVRQGRGWAPATAVVDETALGGVRRMIRYPLTQRRAEAAHRTGRPPGTAEIEEAGWWVAGDGHWSAIAAPGGDAVGIACAPNRVDRWSMGRDRHRLAALDPRVPSA